MHSSGILPFSGQGTRQTSDLHLALWMEVNLCPAEFAPDYLCSPSEMMKGEIGANMEQGVQRVPSIFLHLRLNVNNNNGWTKAGVTLV